MLHIVAICLILLDFSEDLTWSIDLVYNSIMIKKETLPISNFKAQCIAILKRINRGKSSMIVTLRGKPLVEIWPVGWKESSQSRRVMGSQVNHTKILGDIVNFNASTDWDSLK